MFLAFGALTQTIIELELQDRYGKRRKKRMIAKLEKHFIVCGFGRVGRNASFELQRGKVPFVVVDRSDQRVQRATAAGMLAARPHVVEFLDFATGALAPKIRMEQVRVTPRTEFVSKSLGEMLDHRKAGIIVLAIRRSAARMIFNPPLATTISEGDFLIVLGEQPDLEELEKALA